MPPVMPQTVEITAPGNSVNFMNQTRWPRIKLLLRLFWACCCWAWTGKGYMILGPKSAVFAEQKTPWY